MSSLHSSYCGPSGGQVEDQKDFILEVGLCRPTFADESDPGGLMDPLESPSLPSSVKDLGLELAGRPAIRATGVAGNVYYIYMYM